MRLRGTSSAPVGGRPLATITHFLATLSRTSCLHSCGMVDHLPAPLCLPAPTAMYGAEGTGWTTIGPGDKRPQGNIMAGDAGRRPVSRLTEAHSLAICLRKLRTE